MPNNAVGGDANILPNVFELVRAFRLVAGVVIVAGALAAITVASGQTPTPTGSPIATPAPSASPAPTQFPQSLITVRFVRDGQPVTITLAQPISSVSADGAACSVGTLPVVVESPGYSILWPLAQNAGQPPKCAQGPPTVVEFEFLTQVGRLRTFVIWTGQDVAVDLNIPPCAQREPFAPCVFEGTTFEGVESCLFLQTADGIAIGPLDKYPAELMAGDDVKLTGHWEPIIVTFCSHPHGPYFFVVENVDALPVQLPNTGGAP